MVQDIESVSGQRSTVINPQNKEETVDSEILNTNIHTHLTLDRVVPIHKLQNRYTAIICSGTQVKRSQLDVDFVKPSYVEKRERNNT